MKIGFNIFLREAGSLKLKAFSGFTIIELLVVISIIGLVSSVVFASLSDSKNKATIAAGKQFSSSVYHALGSNTVGIYDFEETSGTTATDSSVTGNNGVITGSPSSVSGLNGLAYYFDSSGKYITLPNSANLELRNAITVSAWIKPIGPINTSTWKNIIGKQNEAILAISYGHPRFTIYKDFSPCGAPNYSQALESSGNSGEFAKADVWQNIVGTFDGSKIKVYLNGKLKATTNYAVTICDSNNSYVIGGSNGWGVTNGVIDEVRIYGEALTASAVGKLFAEGLPRHSLAENN